MIYMTDEVFALFRVRSSTVSSDILWDIWMELFRNSIYSILDRG
jgi:hypothetical protein